MALQNIGAANRDDAFYRYKMPKMITKIEGRGNGIKTNVVNMVEIAKALARPASYITKYFGCELGAQSKFDEKNGVSLVNGAHDTLKLAGLLENFIKRYVQCYGCGNPETEVTIGKTQMITLKCAACGFVSDVDMRDKLTSFILKHPPEMKKDTKDKKAMRKAEKERLKEGELADEEQRKMKKEVKKKSVVSAKDGAATKSGVSKKKGNTSDEERIPKGKIKKPSKKVNGSDEADADDNEVDNENDDVQWQTDTSLEAARQRIQEQLNEVTAEMVMLSTDGQKTGEKSKKQAVENGLTVNENGKPGEKCSAHDDLVLVIQDNIKKGVSPSKLAPMLGSLTGTQQEVMTALFEALFVGIEKGFAKEVGKKQPYLAAAIQGNGSQIVLLRAIEVFCEKSGTGVVKEVALVVKVLYDGDVLEEDSIMQWYHEGLAGRNKNHQMWKNMKPLIEWLKSAESESEEE